MSAAIRPMAQAPRTGTTILLLYRPQHYWAGKWHPTGTKWEQCRWMDNPESGSKPHWEPWCGSPKITTTQHIEEEDCLGWMPLPQSELDELNNLIHKAATGRVWRKS